MITIIIFTIFITLILFTTLYKEYFTGKIISENNNDKKILRKEHYIKNNKLINNDIYFKINNTKTIRSHKDKLIVNERLNTEINDNNRFIILHSLNKNIDIAIYHPLTNTFLTTINENELALKSLNIFNTNYQKNTIFNLINTNNKLNNENFFIKSKVFNKYISLNDKNEIVLTNEPVSNINIIKYTRMNSFNSSLDNLIKKELVKKETPQQENFNNVSKSNLKNKKNILDLLFNNVINSNNVEKFNDFDYKGNNIDKYNFNIFSPHLKYDYEKLFNSYGKNLYSDNLQFFDGVSVIDYLKNFNLALINKNNELQTYIDKNNMEMSNDLNTKISDLELLDLAHESLKYYTFLDNSNNN